MVERVLLKNQHSDGLYQALVHHDVCAGLARRLQVLAVKEGRECFPDQMPDVRRSRWDHIRGQIEIPHLKVVHKTTSPTDGFTKYLFQGEGPGLFEAVRIPLMHQPGKEKYIVCVSSQVGCSAGCAFCATGRMGLMRNLSTWEIVDQVIKVQQDSTHRVGGVVFMGMGEPFLNYARVMEASRVMSDPCGLGIDSKSVTISTVGIVPMIRRFTQEKRRNRLIVSLTSAIPSVRDQLLPMNQTYSIAQIMDALRAYQAQSRRRVTLAWTMISGVNLNRDEAKALALATAGLRIILDLIPVNDTTGRFHPPSDEEYRSFLDILNEEVRCPVARRYSGGADVQAACGMLAADISHPCELVGPKGVDEPSRLN